MGSYIPLLYISTGITLTLAMQVWFRRTSAAARCLFFLLLAIAIASFAYAMNLGSSELARKIAWNRVEYLGSAFIPVLMLAVTLALTGHGKWVGPGPLTALLALPLLSMLANWTNTWHRLYYTREWIDFSGPLPILAKARGQLYALKFGYAYLVTILALVLIVRALVRPRNIPRTQSMLLLAAFLVPFLFNLPYTLRLQAFPHINLTLAGFFISGLLLSAAIFRFQLLSTLPLDMKERYDLLLHHAHALLYTISPSGIMTYVTPNWHLLLGQTAEEVMGRNFRDFVLPEDHAVCSAFLERVVKTDSLQTGVEYRIAHKNGSILWHTSSVMPVKDRRNRLLAYVGAAHDITRLKGVQQELSATNQQLSQLIASRESELRQAIRETLTAAESEDRRIGEDIHDGLCQDLIGMARLAESFQLPSDHACLPCREAFELCRRESMRLAGIARSFSRDLTLHDLELQTLSEALETLVRHTESLSRIDIELNLPDRLLGLSSEQNQHIYRIVRESVANAVKHAQPRRIWIEMVREDEKLIVSISNDGLPLPVPAPLGDGIGMKQMRMRTRLLGGQLHIRQTQQSLTLVELIVPLEGESR